METSKIVKYFLLRNKISSTLWFDFAPSPHDGSCERCAGENCSQGETSNLRVKIPCFFL